MNDRRKILDLFEQQKEYTDKRISEGIEKYRKGNAEIMVTDKSGRPIPNVAIKAKQKSHEFRFGANLFMLDELETEEKNEKYKTYFADVFNMATLPFYWDTLEPERGKPRYAADSPKIYRRPAPDHCIEYCEKHGIEPREHGLAYEHFLPKWLHKASVEEIKKELERRCAEISERYADKIPTIEVTNEMDWLSGVSAFYDEPDYVEFCFKLAKKYFPNNQLCINETTRRCWKDKCRPTDKYYAYIEANMLKGAPIEAIGMQYHAVNHSYDRSTYYNDTRVLFNPKMLYKHMDMYANFGKPLHITEITIPAYSWEAEDEQIQAELLEKLYSIWFSHPNVEQIVYWNLADGYAHLWDPDPEKIKASQGNMSIGENYFHGGLLRFDLSPKPAYYTIKNLIQNVWHTEEECVTDQDGACSFRGFYGTYELDMVIDGKPIRKTIDVSNKKNNKILVVI